MRVALATVGTTGDVRPFAILAGALVDRGRPPVPLAGFSGGRLAERTGFEG